MALWDQVTSFLALNAFQESKPVQTRSGTLEDILSRATGSALRTSPWRYATTKEALGVPAIYRAVSFIANTMGALSLEAYRSGAKMPNDDRPRIIIRPDPFRIPRDFFRDTGWNMASLGEAWWWIGSRDADGLALSCINVPPQEIQVTENAKDLRYPIIEWRGKRMPNADMVQITLNRLPGELRGVGPLQLCGAAASVAVEAQEWAANFYAEGGVPSTVIKSAVSIDDEEALALKTQWLETPNNVPRIIDPSIESVEDHSVDVASKSMFEARDFQNAEAARMFGVSASLLDIPVGGSSLTYQNLEQEFTKFVKTCLWPNYLEPVEQSMSDLLTRQIVTRFNVDAFVRPDTKTRFEVYKLAVDAGVMTAEQAAVIEGIEPGDVENAPMPFGSPQAVPTSLPIQRTDAMRCTQCGKLLAEAAGFGTQIRCPRCKLLNVA